MEKEFLKKTLACLEHRRNELSAIDLEITKKALPALDEIIEHINAPLMVMVMGEFSTGKSTFINAMVGKEVAAVNATPTTAVITKLCYGSEDKIRVHLIDGTEEEYETDSFKELTAKTGITGEDTTHASIEYVERQMPLDILQYVTIIDSPGLNDINEQHSDTTKKFVHNSDTVFWMFSALQTGSKTEITAMESLSPRLKPIAIVNKMDEIDEDEDDPKEFLDNIRIQLKDKVQAVVGISAKFALEGKLENNKDKAEIGNFKELEQVVKSLVLPNRDKFKLNSLMDELGEWVNSFASDIKETQKINQRNQDADYDEYLDLKVKLQHSEEALASIIGSIKEYVVDESKKYNEQAMYLLGVLYAQGVIFAEDDKLAEHYLEAAAIKNHTLAQTSLGAMYYYNNDFKKAKIWLKKAVSQNNKLAFSLLGVIYLTDEKTGKLDLQKSNTDKAVPLLEKAASLGEDNAQYFLYNLFINGTGINKDTERAYKYLMQSAGNGNENALITLGKLYVGSFEEDGDKEDIIKSVDCFSEAAKTGNAEAIFNLGEIYRKFWANEDRLEKSFQWYKKAALLGNAEAQYWIARYYETGSGVEKDPGQAVIWYKKSAEQDYIDAQCNLAICYLEGIGVEKDMAQVCYWLEKAGNLGNIDAQIWLARHYHNNKELDKAFNWYMKAAERGNAEAQNMVGRCYEEGWGVEKNPFSSFDWYKKAANQRDSSAAYNVAVCYQEGKGINKDSAYALMWYEIAAEQGFADAQFMAGQYYEDGLGTPKDAYKAFDWYKKAANQGKVEAQNKIGNCYYSGFGTDTDDRKAFEWWKKAADQNLIDAERSLAWCYQEGIGTEKNDFKAFELYKKLAEKGDAEAQKTVGEYFENGIIVDGIGAEVDESAAYEWYKKAAEQGLVDAQYKLARCYENGLGVRKDYLQAFKWYKKAAEQGLAIAQYNLGKYYLEGPGIEKNEREAFRWFVLAAENDVENAEVEIAKCYKNGTGVLKNREKSCAILVDLAKRGNINAQFELAKSCSDVLFEKVYKEGYSDDFNIEECFKDIFNSYSKLTANGDPENQYKLAYCYEHGIGTEENYENAYFWYTKSADQGYKDAKENADALALILKVNKKIEDIKNKFTYERVYTDLSKKKENEPIIWYPKEKKSSEKSVDSLNELKTAIGKDVGGYFKGLSNEDLHNLYIVLGFVIFFLLICLYLFKFI